MEDKTYNIDFKEALDYVLDGGTVKGENFASGVFLKINNHGTLVTVDANNFYRETECPFILSLSRQKFRKLTVLTIKELEF